MFFSVIQIEEDFSFSRCKNIILKNVATQKPKRILGIDPGTNILGYGIIEVHNGRIKLVEMNVLRLGKIDNHYQKLKNIFNEIRKIIRDFSPEEVAVEAPFFGKNVQSMLKLGRAQGVAITAVMMEGMDVFEYSPRKIKQSITGKGNASKEQVSAMLSSLLNIDTKYVLLDATDAVAVALCHHFQSGNLIKGAEKKFSSWENFVKENPERIR